MQRAIAIFVLLAGHALAVSAAAPSWPVHLLQGQAWTPVPLAQRVVDRIVARLEDDIITLSEVRELGRFQQLVEGRSASGEELLRQLIEQWIVASEATASRFPRPVETDVNREMARLEQQFPSLEAYRARLRELGLADDTVRRLLARQLWLTRYLDYKFRPATQVADAQIERYYREELAPRLAAGNQAVPVLEQVREQIREVLTQRDINQRVERWLEEARPQLRIEVEPGGVTP